MNQAASEDRKDAIARAIAGGAMLANPMIGTWKSKTTDLVVEVVKIVKGVIWYNHPAWNFLCDCNEQVFRESMEQIPPSVHFSI